MATDPAMVADVQRQLNFPLRVWTSTGHLLHIPDLDRRTKRGAQMFGLTLCGLRHVALASGDWEAEGLATCSKCLERAQVTSKGDADGD